MLAENFKFCFFPYSLLNEVAMFSVDIYTKTSGILWDKQHKDNVSVEMRPPELMAVTNVKN